MKYVYIYVCIYNSLCVNVAVTVMIIATICESRQATHQTIK